MAKNDESNLPRRKAMLAAPIINVTPMIDVLLVLLIIFMVIAPTRPARFQAQVPDKPQANDPPSLPGLLMVWSNREAVWTRLSN